MLTILFFGQLKDVLKTDGLSIDWVQGDKTLDTVSKLRVTLQKKGDSWHEYLAAGKALVAVNHEMAADNSAIHKSDEIAFFPPVTGG